LFATLVDALDELVDALPDIHVTPEQFVDLLRLLLGEVSLSRIPTSMDEVTVGSADTLRLHEPKHIYLLGVNEGEFPATVSEVSIFSDGDRHALQKLGLSIEPDLLLRSARELFCFARAFAAAAQSVTVLFTEQKLSGEKQEPSVAVKRLLSLSGLPVASVGERDRLDHLWRKHAAADYLGLLHGTEEGTALERCLGKESAYARTVQGLDMPLSEADCRLSAATASALYGGGMYLSQSRIDQYARCPFSYFCRYVLKLEDNEIISFDHAEIGTMLHAILEKFIAVLSAREISAPAADYFEIVFHGKSCHGATPDQGADALLAAAYTIVALQTLTAREQQADDPFVLTVGKLQAGTAGNAIAERAQLQGTMRAYSESTRARIKKRMEEILTNIAKAFRATAHLEFTSGCPTLLNDASLSRLVTKYMKELLGPDKSFTKTELLEFANQTSAGKPIGSSKSSKATGSEDFAYFSHQVPSIMLAVAAGNFSTGCNYPLHHPEVTFDEKVLGPGSAVYAYSAIRLLNN
jgi:hypothetical protein